MRSTLKSIPSKIVKWWHKEVPGIHLPVTRLGKSIFYGLLVMGILLRLWGLDWGMSYSVPKGPPHHDENHDIHNVVTNWEDFKKTFSEYEIARPAFFLRLTARPIIQVISALGLNSEENSVVEVVVPRLINSLFGILGLLAAYLLATKISHPTGGLMALAILVFMPGHWYHSQMIKFDVAVGTCNTLLVLAAIYIYQRRTWFWLIFAGVVLGLGTSMKLPAAIMLPPLVLTMIAVIIKNPQRWKDILKKIVVFGAISLITLLAFYPYPYLDFNRWYTLMTDPTSITHERQLQKFEFNLDITPAHWLGIWNEYNKPLEPLTELAFGQAPQKLFPYIIAAFILYAWAYRKQSQGAWYVITIASAALIAHSLSFIPAYGERYLLVLAPIVAAMIGSLAIVPPQWSKKAGIAMILMPILIAFIALHNAATTAAIFPTFALGKDVRQQIPEYLESIIKPGETVGAFEATGRQGLPINRDKVPLEEMSTGGEDPHLTGIKPAYIVFLVEPWNTDGSIRYQLFTPEIRHEFFDGLLQDYTFVKRFGAEPTLFGRVLPRRLGTPIYDLYRRK
jgi:hypothetical protein